MEMSKMTIDKSKEAIIERLRKVLALANEGTGGEKANAERQLAAMLKKYGMTMDELTGNEDPIVEAKFKTKNDYEEKLARQVIAAIMDTRMVIFSVYKGKPREKIYDMPRSKALEAMMNFDIYRKALERTMQTAFSAFVMANNIYPATPGEDRELSKEEMMQAKKAAAMAMGAERVSIHKMIED